VGSAYWGGLASGVWLRDDRILYSPPSGMHTMLSEPFYVVYDYGQNRFDSLLAYGSCEECFGRYGDGEAFVTRMSGFGSDTLEILITEGRGFRKIFSTELEGCFAAASAQLSPNGRYAVIASEFCRNKSSEEPRNLVIDMASGRIDTLNMGYRFHNKKVIFDTDTSFYFENLTLTESGGTYSGLYHFVIGGEAMEIDPQGVAPAAYFGDRYLVTYWAGSKEGELWCYDTRNNFAKSLIDQSLPLKPFEYDPENKKLIYSRLVNINSDKTELCAYSFLRNEVTVIKKSRRLIFNPHIIKLGSSE